MAIISGGKVIEGAIGRPGVVTDSAVGAIGPFEKAGALANGDFNGTAKKGALAVDTVGGKLYINTGTLAATAWTVVGTQV
jgi:hypothetical protein